MTTLKLEIPIIPPSENKIRVIRVIKGRAAGIAYKKEAIDFKKAFNDIIRNTYMADIQRLLSTHTPTSIYSVDIIIHFPKEELVNKGWPNTTTYYKKIDIGNRRKLLEDCLSEALTIDDSVFFALNMTKLISEEQKLIIIVEQYDDATLFGDK
jgi:Holliday junction resolvase RusA-like endonuclease